jgi:hypothetical protein
MKVAKVAGGGRGAEAPAGVVQAAGATALVATAAEAEEDKEGETVADAWASGVRAVAGRVLVASVPAEAATREEKAVGWLAEAAMEAEATAPVAQALVEMTGWAAGTAAVAKVEVAKVARPAVAGEVQAVAVVTGLVRTEEATAMGALAVVESAEEAGGEGVEAAKAQATVEEGT